MKLTSSLILMVTLVVATKAQLLCFYCDDCTVQNTTIQPCGINYETIAPPATTNPTTEVPATTNPTTEVPATTNPTTDGPATPTLPTTISTTVAAPSDLATPPITPLMPTEQMNSRLVISLDPPSPRYVCLVLEFIVDNREVIRRGCTELGPTVEETCNIASGGQHVNCSVCMTHMCNRG